MIVPPAVGETIEPPTVGSFSGSRSGPPNLIQPRRPVRVLAVLARNQMLAGHAINREEVSIARRRERQLALLAVEHAIDQHRRLRRIPIVHIVR